MSENYVIRRGRKEDLKGRPCLRHENVKLYTLFKTEDPEGDTLTVGTSLYREYMGVPPPPLPLHSPCAISGTEYFPSKVHNKPL